jgi:hypothetical protein
MFAPLTEESEEKEVESPEVNEEEDFCDETRQDILLRFVFDRYITESMVKDIAIHVQRLIRDKEIEAKTVSWEGINMMTTLQYKDAMAVYPWVRHFSNSLFRIRRRGETSPTDESPTKEAPQPPFSTTCVDEDVQATTSSSPYSTDDSLVITPNSGRTIEPEIVEDKGVSTGTPFYLDTSSCVSPSPNFDDPGKFALTPDIPCMKRELEVDCDEHEPPAKRDRIGGKN